MTSATRFYLGGLLYAIALFGIPSGLVFGLWTGLMYGLLAGPAIFGMILYITRNDGPIG